MKTQPTKTIHTYEATAVYVHHDETRVMHWVCAAYDIRTATKRAMQIFTYPTSLTVEVIS